MPQGMVALYLASASSFVAQTMTRPLVSLFAVQLGADPLGVGFIMAAYAALPLFLAVPFGAWTDRFGPRAMITWGSVAFSLAALGVAWRPGLVELALGQAVMGSAQLCVVVAAQTMAGSTEAGATRERSLGLFTTFSSVGQLIGPLLGGWTADVSSYAAAFALSGALGLLTLLFVGGLPSTDPDVARNKGGAVSLRGVRGLLRNGAVKAGMASSFAVLFAMGVREAFFPLYLQSLGYSATVVGALLSVRALASIAVRPWMSSIIGACGGRFNVLAGSLTALAVGIFSIPYTQSLLPLALTSALIGVGIGLCQPMSMLAVADSVPADTRGLAMGVRLTGNRLAQLVNPLFFGAVSTLLGIGAAFMASGLLLFGTTLFLFRWQSYFHRTDPHRTDPHRLAG